MGLRNSKCIMAKNIHLDKNYINVLTYNDAQMVTLLTNNAVQTFNDASFIRPDKNVIKLNMSYDNALKCNYLGVQNPWYSNKWFFGFIDEIEYVSDDCVQVHFTVDEFQTWYDYWQPEMCFVEREHANTDVAGDNLVPEQLELGDYIVNGDPVGVGFLQGSLQTFGQDLYCWTSIYTPSNHIRLATNICGIPISGGLYVTEEWDDMAKAIQSYSDNQHQDTITSAFILPFGMCNLNDTSLWERETVTTTAGVATYHIFKGSNVPFWRTTTVSAPSALNSYTPVNQKLLTHPFMCLVLSNSAGSSNVLAYEYFSNRASCEFETVGTLSIGGSIFTFPKNYKNLVDAKLEGVSGGKFPTLSWSGDAFTNWLTQNAVNTSIGVIGDMATAAVGASFLAAGNPAGLAGILGGAGGIANTAKETIQHSVTPQVSVGNVNNGDVITSMRQNVTIVTPMSIRADMAERIDKYFTRYGYQTNKLKIPNQTGRLYWNFVKIGAGEEIGHSTSTDVYSVPASAMETINKIYQKGVTLWHDHANIGDYSLSNTIVS